MQIRVEFTASRLGSLLRTAREKAGMTVEEVVSDLPISAEDLLKIETGEITEVQPLILLALAAVLGLDTNELLDAVELGSD